MTNLKAVIPVAGLGMHMLPATKAIPKEMLPIVDKPMIQYIVDEIVAAGDQRNPPGNSCVQERSRKPLRHLL
ncbi:putative UTP-glucose-1-phosphate uridylyltransferase [Escherichia coli]|uniref:UTP--glucose-1-phosphate uridylyltransferase n=1 Tax=Escherichia coli TaxID=562 RepID=A0A377D600_ECOLX|nr:putative UTP-glucose-1-phosphate uridylyltransferase [Escherichia coli]